MNWSVISAFADLVAALTVILSLVYLARQIKLNTDEIANSNEQARLAALERNIESGNKSRELLFLYPDLTRIFIRGQRDPDSLSADDRLRFEMLLRNLFSSIQGAYIRQLSVQHDPLAFKGSEKVIDELLNQPGTREWLKRAEPDWRPEFKAMISERLKKYQE